MRPTTFTLATLALSQRGSSVVDFVHEVVPVLTKHCVECHGGEKSKGGLSLNTWALLLEADVLERGDPKKSLMTRRFSTAVPRT
jgi:hypothetical protein